MVNNESIAKQDAEKILVTGGAGFLGKAIVRRLINRGDNVRSLARNFYPALAEMGVDQIQGDISDSEFVAKSCEDRNVAFHVAAKPPPWGKYADYYNTNVKGTQNVIDACIQHSVSRLIYTSTPSVIFTGNDLEGVDESFPYPPNYNAFYPETKAMAEQRVVKAARTKLRTIILRPHQIWGPEDPHFVPRLLDRAKKLKRIGMEKI
jgi:nucleoside-diphosphate-sugar epimerase